MAQTQVRRGPRPAIQREELVPERVFAGLGLLERRHRQLALAREPAILPVPPQVRLDLHDEQPVLGMDDDEVGLAVARGCVQGPLQDPAPVAVEAVVGGEGTAEAIVDLGLRCLA